MAAADNILGAQHAPPQGEHVPTLRIRAGASANTAQCHGTTLLSKGVAGFRKLLGAQPLLRLSVHLGVAPSLLHGSVLKALSGEFVNVGGKISRTGRSMSTMGFAMVMAMFNPIRGYSFRTIQGPCVRDSYDTLIHRRDSYDTLIHHTPLAKSMSSSSTCWERLHSVWLKGQRTTETDRSWSHSVTPDTSAR